MEITQNKKLKVKKNFVKNLINIFEQSERFICDNRMGPENLRPVVVRILNKRNKNLFLKYLTEKAIPSMPRKLEINYTPADEESNKQSGDSSLKTETIEKSKKEKEISIACQTEAKSSSPSQKTFSSERRVLENRIAVEKQSQIKWIEKEIHHLNNLRNLLEKQNKSTERKQNYLDSSKSDEKNFSKTNTTENQIRPAEMVEEPILLNKDKKMLDENIISNSKTQSPSLKENELLPLVTDTNYSMAVSLVGRVRKVMMFPIGVEFNVNDPELRCRCSPSSDADSDVDQRHSGRPWPNVSQFFKPQTSNTATRRHYPSQDFTEYPRTQPWHSNVNTQFPSVERDGSGPGPSHTISVQTDFSVLRKCKNCHQDICVCLSLSKSDKSDATASGFSKVNSNYTERKESLKMNFNNKNEFVGNTRSSSITPEVVEIVNYSKDLNGASRGSNGRRLSSICKCENCPKHNSSGIQRSGVVYGATSNMSQNPCESNIYVTCEKSNDVGQPRCSKVQIEKSPNCACHIIKIHDSKCCSIEGRTGSFRRKSPVKRMESQASQTEYIVVDKKSLVSNPELVKPSKAPETIYQIENRVGIEEKRSVEKKFSYKPKVSIERRHAVSSKIRVKEKSAVAKEFSNSIVSENGVVSEVNSECKCGCQKSLRKEELQEIQEDDHPRHYFLKIEEKEVDDSNESLAVRPSLDVITVTVPVKRSNKSKVTGKKNLRSYASNQCSLESIKSNQKNGGCNCCERCIGRYCQQISQQYEIQNKGQYRKTKAEKPCSPNVNDRRYSKVVENCSYEEVPDYEESNSKDFVLNPHSSSSQDYYQKETVNYKRSDTYFSRPSSNYSTSYNGFQQQDKRNENREVQIDYDSHKDYGSLNYYYNGALESEEVRSREVSRDGRRYYYYPSEPEKPNQNFDERFQSDYYNYDKKEYMTRSEVQKEESKKRKAQQPSLQKYLESNRPDFYNSAESRRRVISQRAKEREKKQKSRMECLMNLMHQCNESEQLRNDEGTRRMFTTSQMKEQTMKLYKNLPEVTGKIADQKKRDEYRTNKLMADVFAKKLQLEALKGSCDCQCEDYF